MMKAFCICILAILFLNGCKKESAPVSTPDNLITEAKEQFEKAGFPAFQAANQLIAGRQDLRLKGQRTPVWKDARMVRLSFGNAVEVPIHYQDTFYVSMKTNPGKFYSINDITKLLVYKDSSGQFHNEMVTYFPDNHYEGKGKPFRGIINVEDWQGKLLKRFQYDKTGTVLRQDLTRQRAQASNQAQVGVTICYEITLSVYAANDPGNAYTWIESLGCNTYFFDTDSGGGGSGFGYGGGGGSGSNISPASTVTMYSAPSPIGNVPDYLKCFTSSPASDYHYSVTVCVDQPQPGSRTPWIFGANSSTNPFMTGHTYLLLTENAGGAITARNIGFYPAMTVFPGSETSPGQWGNDYNRNYSVALNIPLDNSSFMLLLAYIQSAATSHMQFNLNYNNCTSFTLNALASIGINLPRTKGSWLMGGGYDPGDLGEDIRAMEMDSQPWSRSFTNTAHPNRGICY